MQTRIAIGFVALMLSCAVASAQTAKPASTPPPNKITTVAGITEYRLANGLTVLLFPDPSKPTVTVNVTYLVGSRHEGYGETGMAHLLEHMVFKGTPTRPDIVKEMNQHGARYNGTTSFDRTNYFEMVQATPENIRWAIEMEADRMVNSKVARADLDSEMSVVRNEYERGENNPGGVLYKRLQSVAFDWHNYQNSPIGNRSDIENVGIDNLRAFYRKYYQPDNAVLLVAGQFDEAHVLTLIRNSFGKIPKPTRTLPKMWTAEPTQDGERSFTVRRSGNIQMVLAGYKIPSMVHPDWPALSVAASILGNTPNGRLHKLLVEPNKAVSTSAGAGGNFDPGLLTVSMVVKENEPLEPVQAQLIGAIESFADAPPTEEELNRVRMVREKNFEQTLSSSESLGLALSESIANGDWRLWFLNRERIAAVTVADVQRVAKTYLRRDNRTVGVFYPTKEPERAEVPPRPLLADVMKDFKPSDALAAGEAFDPTPANIDARTERFTLANGMKVALLSKRTRGQTVNVSLRSRNGDEQTRFGKSAVLSMMSPMIGRGSTRFTRAQTADEFDRLKISGFVSGGGANIQTTRPNLVAALELAAHLMKEPTFPESEFEQLRKQTLAGLESDKSEPGAVSGEVMGKHFNGYQRGDPRYFESREERIEDIRAVTLDQVKQAHRDFTGFSHAEVAIVGDFDVTETRAALERLFGSWNSTIPYRRLEIPYANVAPANKTLLTPDKENAVFRAQMMIEMRDDDPEYPALVLGNYIFGGAGLNSRLSRRIRGKEGLTYGTGSSLSVSDQDRRGTFSANATAAPQNIARVEELFLEELQIALRDGFKAEELATAKHALLTSRRQSRANDGAVAGSWADRLYLDRSFLEAAEMDEKLQAVTLEQLNAAFRKYIEPSKLVIVKAGDFAKASS